MAILRKVSIDEFITLLSQMRKNTAYVDMKIEPGNVLKVTPSDAPVKKSKEEDELPDLNQLLG